MTTVPVRWKVRALLERHGLSTYRFWKESGLSMGAAYRLARGDTSSLNADTLDKAMGALQRLTGEALGVADLVEYEPASVYVVSEERDVTAVVGELVRLRHPTHYFDLVARRGADGAIQDVLAAWVQFGRAFATEREAEQHSATLAAGVRWFVHAVAPMELRTALEDVGAIKEADMP